MATYSEGFSDGWRAAMERMEYEDKVRASKREETQKRAPAAKKRKASAYAKRYGRAFKKVSKKYKKKSGGWMKNGFQRAQREAHKIARRGK